MLGKLHNGELIIAPKTIKHNGRVYHNPKDEVYIDAGYCPIVEIDMPENQNDKKYKKQYELIEGTIFQTWVEDETVEEIAIFSYKEEVIAKIKEYYSIDDEIAILRQRDTKPEEFEEYNNFVEQCKIQIKEKLEIL